MLLLGQLFCFFFHLCRNSNRLNSKNQMIQQQTTTRTQSKCRSFYGNRNSSNAICGFGFGFVYRAITIKHPFFSVHEYQSSKLKYSMAAHLRHIRTKY